MPTPTTKNIVTAAFAIAKMDKDAMETLLSEILSANPTSTIKVMAESGIKFADLADTRTYMIVLDTYDSGNKIGLIKFVREQTGAGLADSKGWAEGLAIPGGMKSGVLFCGLSKSEAEVKVAEINKKAKDGYITPTGWECPPSPIRVKMISETQEFHWNHFVGWKPIN